MAAGAFDARKIGGVRGVLWEMSASGITTERLGRLLRLLPPAPEAWVVEAKRSLLERVRTPVRPERSLTERDLARLTRALETDPAFRSRFDVDPVAAAGAAGMSDVASALEHELRSLVRLAERVANDHAYRAELESSPAATLAAEGIPVDGAQPLFEALALAQQALPEVVAHSHADESLRAQLVTLLLGSSAVRENVRAAASGAR